ncbi:hypothetical protein Droror1_Dr00002438, partial [Drosera rotundifolia]
MPILRICSTLNYKMVDYWIAVSSRKVTSVLSLVYYSMKGFVLILDSRRFLIGLLQSYLKRNGNTY